jgi:hypothetical protein
MCRVPGVHSSGYYAWLVHPESARAIEDLRELGESCGKCRVERLTHQHGIYLNIEASEFKLKILVSNQ